jgi:hypothetical protein
VGDSGSDGSESGDPLFTCDACSKGIAQGEERFHCLLCRNFDLCAACYGRSLEVGVILGDSHSASHPVTRLGGLSDLQGGTSVSSTPLGSLVVHPPWERCMLLLGAFAAAIVLATVVRH